MANCWTSGDGSIICSKRRWCGIGIMCMSVDFQAFSDGIFEYIVTT